MAKNPVAGADVGEDGGPSGGKVNYGGLGSPAKRFAGRGSREPASAHGKYATEGNDPEMAKGFDVVSGNPPEIPAPTFYKGARNPKPASHRKQVND